MTRASQDQIKIALQNLESAMVSISDAREAISGISNAAIHQNQLRILYLAAEIEWRRLGALRLEPEK